jgi:bis(5'-nucleosyl)-tetraphosphatase (symmetrical)
VQRIFVGDVQGCADELDELIARARGAFGGEFELWSVGDLVNRGPASLRVLATVRALADAGRARCVLGNHEVSLLRVAAGLRALEPGDTFQEVLEAGGDWLDWLRAQPLAIEDRLGDERFAVVHAAVAPGWSIDEIGARARRVETRLAASRAEANRLLALDRRADADADVLARTTRCRRVDARGRWSSREPARREDAWHVRWRAAAPDYGVVYGHWATQGVHVARLLRGLDSGCVYNGAWGPRHLTAWLPARDAAHPFEVPDDHFWRIAARRRYVRSAP